MSEFSDKLGWQFSAGFAVGAIVMLLLVYLAVRDRGSGVRGRTTGTSRAVQIIHQVTAREMTGPGVKDASARLAAAVFIAAIEADDRIQRGGRPSAATGRAES